MYGQPLYPDRAWLGADYPVCTLASWLAVSTLHHLLMYEHALLPVPCCIVDFKPLLLH